MDLRLSEAIRSEAIRLGAMLHPQAFGALTIETRSGWLGIFGKKLVAECALQGAIAAAGCVTGRSNGDDASVPVRGDIPSQWTVDVPPEWNLFLAVSCPVCEQLDVVGRIIPHLNDDHRWTRERIADWVESIERERENLTSPFQLDTENYLG
jgi:hypothetical protein